MTTAKEKAEYTVKEMAKRRKAKEVEINLYQLDNRNKIKRRIR